MTAPFARYVDPVERLAIILWVRVPRAVIRRLPSMWGVAGDGHTLVAFPPLAVLLPFAVPAGAFVVGARHLGYDIVYTESLPLMLAAIAIGALSAQLGLLAVAGFALGEQLLGASPATSLLVVQRSATEVARERLAMVVTYLLLAVAVVVVPRVARALALAVGRWRPLPAAIAWPLASGICVVVVFLALRTWVAAAPTLVRPRFTWLGGMPTVEAIQAIQVEGDELIAAGVIATIVRQVLIGLSMWWAPVRDRVRTAEADRVRSTAGSGATRPVAPGRVRRLAGDVGSAGLATLVLAGVLEEGWLWVATFSVFLAVRLLRSGVIGLAPLDMWKRVMAKVPAVVRVVALWVVARVVTDALVRGFVDSYTSIALVVIGGAVVVFALFPGDAPAETETEPEPDRRPPPPGPAPAPAGGA